MPAGCSVVKLTREFLIPHSAQRPPSCRQTWWRWELFVMNVRPDDNVSQQVVIIPHLHSPPHCFSSRAQTACGQPVLPALVLCWLERTLSSPRLLFSSSSCNTNVSINCQSTNSSTSSNSSPHLICGFIMLAFHSVNDISVCQSQIKIIESIKVMTALPVMESSQPVNPGPAQRKISTQ